MQKASIFLATVLIASPFALTGCIEDKPADIVHTVDWYREHEAELKEVLKKCNNNPGELAATPNCVNAGRAKHLNMAGDSSKLKLVLSPPDSKPALPSKE